MRRLPSSYNQDDVSDQEIDEVFLGLLRENIEIPLIPRDHGERVLYVGFTSSRATLVEIGLEDRNGELVVFHARQATVESIKAYKSRY